MPTKTPRTTYKTTEELLIQISKIPADLNNPSALSLAKIIANKLRISHAATVDFINKYCSLITETKKTATLSKSLSETLNQLHLALNAGFFIHFHLIKNQQLPLPNGQRVIVNLWATISMIINYSSSVFSRSPLTGLNLLRPISLILEPCYLEIRQLANDIRTKNTKGLLPEVLQELISKRLPKVIDGYSDVLETFHEMYIQIGDMDQANKYYDMAIENLERMRREKEELQLFLSDEHIDRRYHCSLVAIENDRKKIIHLNSAKENIGTHLALLTQKVKQFREALPEHAFEPAVINMASLSCTDNLETQFDTIKSHLSSLLTEAFLFIRINRINTQLLEETFTALNKLGEMEHRENAERNLEAAIELCTRWADVYTVGYTDETAPVVNQWNEIIKILADHLNQLYSRIPDYFEPLLLEISRLNVTMIDRHRISLLSNFPSRIPGNFQNRFQQYVVTHARFAASDEMNIESFTTAQDHIAKLQENASILHFTLKKINIEQIITPYTDQLIHLLCQTLASINHANALLLKEKKIPQELLAAYTEQTHQNYGIMSYYSLTYQKFLQSVNDSDFSIDPFIQTIKPTWPEALYRVMTGYMEHALFQWQQGAILNASKALLLIYNSLKYLSLPFPKEQHTKIINDVHQLTLSIYLSAFNYREFEDFIRQLSEKKPDSDVQQIPFPDTEFFWEAYRLYLEHSDGIGKKPMANHIMHHVILDSRINVFHYFLKHMADKSSPLHQRTMEVLWESSYQRYNSAMALSQDPKLCYEHQITENNMALEQYKKHVESLIPSIKKLKNKTYNAQIASFKQTINSKGFTLEELEEIDQKNASRRKKSNRSASSSVKQSAALPKKKNSSEPKAPLEKAIMPRSHVVVAPPQPSQQLSCSGDDGPWFFQNQKKKGPGSPGSVKSKPISSATSSSQSISMTRTASSSSATKAPEKTPQRYHHTASFDTYKGIQRPNAVFAQPPVPPASMKTPEMVSPEPASFVHLQSVSDNNTAFSYSAEEFIPEQFRLDSTDCPVVDIDSAIFQLSPEILEVCFRLHAAGYKVYIAGGLIRDRILGLTPNDVDIITNCPRDKVNKLLNYRGKLSVGRPDLYLLCPGVDIISSDVKNLVDEARKRDLKCNALFYSPIEDKLYDPLNCYGSLDNPTLTLIGDAYSRLKEDPSRILRIIRFSHSLKKEIEPDVQTIIESLAPEIAKLPLGIRISNIIALFFRNFDLAMANYQSLIKHKIISYLFPSNENETAYYPESSNMENVINQYWSYSLFALYQGNNESFPNCSPLNRLISLLFFIRLKGYEAEKKVSFATALSSTVELVKSIYPDEHQYSILSAITCHQKDYDSFTQAKRPTIHWPLTLLHHEGDKARLGADAPSHSPRTASSSMVS